MVRIFDRNMFIMLIAIMVGVIIVTYFFADIQRRTQIETLEVEHFTEISDIYERNQNFTDHFLQGSVKMDAGRETREVANYFFDFAMFWYNTALRDFNSTYIAQCIENCTSAMVQYLSSHESFQESKPLFIKAATFTNQSKYLEILGFYQLFAESGKNITMLRYQASEYLKHAVENLSSGDLENYTELIALFNDTLVLYDEAVGGYIEYKEQIDDFLFFSPIREEYPEE